MQLLDNFKHAETFAQMPMGERVQATLYVIMLGMSITFVALVFIWGLTILLSKVVQSIEKKSQPAVMPAPKTASAPAPAAIEKDDSELVAVITAAIAASMNTSMHNIVVTNIVRTGDGAPVWGRLGRSDVMNSRL